MIKATATLESMSPYQQGRHYEVEKREKESSEDYEKRTWRERMHCDANGECFIPPMALKNCLNQAAKYLSIQIKGKGKATYTKHIESGVMCIDPLPLGIKKCDVQGTPVFVPSDGRVGGTKRVTKYFPTFHSWKGDVVFFVFDETVTKDIFLQHLEEAGKFIGLGVFRPRCRGYYGRFKVTDLQWEEVSG